MKKYSTYLSGICVLLAVVVFVSCGEKSTDPPTIQLSQTTATGKSGDEISVSVTTATDGGFKSLVVTKLWDGDAQDSETFNAPLSSAYTYTVVDEDADHVVTINFTVTDNEGRTASAELVVSIELTARQILLKYNWQKSSEIRDADDTDYMNAAFADDVYRFNADGTFNKSFGSTLADFDGLNVFCSYDLNDNTVRLLLLNSGLAFAFGDPNGYTVDTLDITVIDENQFTATTTIYGLDFFGPPFTAVEPFTFNFVAIPKSSSFDPYGAGATDDANGWNCPDVQLVNP